MKLRLHSRYQNSAGQRVRIVLNLKGVPYEYVPVASPSAPEYGAMNPQRLLPTLEIDGHHVAQSMAIIELIEELFPRPAIFPADRWLRAETRAFAHLIASDLHPINNQRIRRYLTGAVGASDASVTAWYKHWVATAFASLEAQLARRARAYPFCFGDGPTLADACLVPQIDNARRFGCDLAAYPLLLAADGECRKLDAFQRAAASAQPDYPGE